MVIIQLEKKLQEWVEAQLITKKSADDIRDYEKISKKPYVLYCIAGLASLAICVGLIAIVASNWMWIPPVVKMTIDLVMILCLGISVYLADMFGRKLVREILILVLYGTVLASISLVGQIYHLSSHIFDALLVWTLVTFCLVIFLRSNFAAIVVITALIMTYFCGLNKYEKLLEDQEIICFAFYLLPVFLLFLTQINLIWEKKDNFAKGALIIGWPALLGFTSFFGLGFWYKTSSISYWLGSILGILLTISICLNYWRKSESIEGALVLINGLFFFLPFLIPHSSLDYVSGIFFILLWLCVAWASHLKGLKRIFNFATLIIGIRIIVIYFEVFGSLLNTGLGLVIGGVLTLGILWIWYEYRQKLIYLFGRK